MAAFKLIIEDDAGKQIIVPFAKDVITIGRKEGNTIRLTERNVSRKHAKLSKENGHVLVEDLSSYNGIRLNGERITGRVTVAEGDTIQIGDYHLAIHAQDGAGVRPAPAADPNETAQMRSMAAPTTVAPEDDDHDQFAGDTQRWQPPAELSPVPVGNAMATAEGAALSALETAEETVPAMAAPSAEPNPFIGGDTVRVPAMQNPPSSHGGGAPLLAQARKQEAVLEPTVRQVASPAPVSVPGSGYIGTVPRPSAPPATVSAPNPALTEETATVRASPSPADDVALPRLVVLNTVFSGSSFPLRAAEQVIGRTDENDITIEHRSVSRNHAKLVREGERVRILDLKSANGVLVNDEEVEQAVLQSGDVVELGRVRLRFVPVGERFSVPPDEVERARIADAAGDDFDGDSGTGITNPVRPKKTLDASAAGALDAESFSGLTGRKLPVPVLAGAALLVLLLVVIVALLARSDDGEGAPAVSPLVPPSQPVAVAGATLPEPPEAAIAPEVVDPVGENPLHPAAGAPDPEEPIEPARPDSGDDPEAATALPEKEPRVRTKPSSADRVRRPPVEVNKTKAEVEADINDAMTLFLTGKHREALAILLPLTKTERNNPKLWRLHGMNAQKLNRFATMCAAYAELLRLQPNATDAQQIRENRRAANCK